MADDSELVAAVLDREPRVIKGATLDELIMLVKFFGLSGFGLGLVVGLVFVPSYAIIPAILLALVFLGLGVWLGSVTLITIKRDKPQGYVMQWIALKLSAKLPWYKPVFVYGAQRCSLNRKPVNVK